VQDPESPAAVLVLRLFAIVFEVMAKYNVKTDDILLPVFPRLIARTQELAAAAKHPSGAMGPCIPSVKLRADVSAARICAAGCGGQPDHYSASQGLKWHECQLSAFWALLWNTMMLGTSQFYWILNCWRAGFLRLQVTLFRTISSGKFMDIYNTFAAGPLLVDTINFLTAMLQTPASQADKVPEED
jgi:hypothetical protein